MNQQTDFIGGAGPKLSSGYAGTPGLGPAAEKCGTCKHVCRQGGTQKNYYKCGIGKITGGEGTYIRLKTAACELWEAD